MDPVCKFFIKKSFYILATVLEPVVEIWRFKKNLLKSDELWPLVCYRNPLHMWKLFFQVKIYGEGELTTRLEGYLDRRWWMRLLPCGFCNKYVGGFAPRLQ
jgi:hypothetical protein